MHMRALACRIWVAGKPTDTTATCQVVDSNCCHQGAHWLSQCQHWTQFPSSNDRDEKRENKVPNQLVRSERVLPYRLEVKRLSYITFEAQSWKSCNLRREVQHDRHDWWVFISKNLTSHFAELLPEEIAIFTNHCNFSFSCNISESIGELNFTVHESPLFRAGFKL